MHNTNFKRDLTEVLQVQLDYLQYVAMDILKNARNGNLEEVLDHVSDYLDVEETEDGNEIELTLGDLYAYINVEEESMRFDMSEMGIIGDDYNHLLNQLELAVDMDLLDDWAYDEEYEDILRSPEPYVEVYRGYGKMSSIEFKTKM